MLKATLQRRLVYVGTLTTVVLSVGVSSTAGANYNSNLVGTPTSVIAYEGGNVLFVLDTQPTSSGACKADYFEIDVANNTDAVLGRMFERLLAAYNQKQPVEIGYDNSGACGSFGYIHTYRVG